jgi:hypothetical protein
MYHPVSGHRPTLSAIRYLMATSGIEVALAPVSGTRLLVPFRVTVPTMLGPAVLEATHFIASIETARSTTPTNLKTQ